MRRRFPMEVNNQASLLLIPLALIRFHSTHSSIEGKEPARSTRVGESQSPVGCEQSKLRSGLLE